MSRRRLVASGATATVAAAFLGNAVAQAQAGVALVNKWLLNMEFVFDPRTVDQGGTAPTTGLREGPVYVGGPVYAWGSLNPDGTPKSDARQIGYHRLFGWIYDAVNPLVIGTHTFDIAGRGKIVINSASDGSSAPISGGTGEFRHLEGEIRVALINRANAAYRAQIDGGSGSVGN